MNDEEFESVLDDVRAGKPVVIVDDRDRENEGDLTLAAARTTPENLNFMIQHGRGLICLSLTAQRLEELRIPMQTSENRSRFGTNFAVSINHRSVRELGPTARSRSTTILECLNPEAKYSDFETPGWTFPLRVAEGGVLRRRGQTEGSADLARLAGLEPAGVICEIMAADGTMIRGAALDDYCRTHELKLLSIEDIVQFRLRHEISLRKTAETILPSISLFRDGEYIEEGEGKNIRVAVFVDDFDGEEHLAFTVGEPCDGALVRIHSECLTGDVFQSQRCDCGFQFNQSLKRIVNEGSGVVVYLHQEGRGIGLGNKLRAYALQDQGLDTVDANLQLGFEVDSRNYRAGAKILSELGLRKVRLITNNPEKIRSLEQFGIEVIQREELLAPIDEFNNRYLSSKRDRLGHLLRG